MVSDYIIHGSGKKHVPHVLGLLKADGLSQCACLQINIPAYRNRTVHAQQKMQRSMFLVSYMRRPQGFL
jgi:hypothetical protein